MSLSGLINPLAKLFSLMMFIHCLDSTLLTMSGLFQTIIFFLDFCSSKNIVSALSVNILRFFSIFFCQYVVILVLNDRHDICFFSLSLPNIMSLMKLQCRCTNLCWADNFLCSQRMLWFPKGSWVGKLLIYYTVCILVGTVCTLHWKCVWKGQGWIEWQRWIEEVFLKYGAFMMSG